MRCQMLRDTDTQARIGYSACLTLNRVKTKELVFTASPKTVLPPPRPDIERVTSLRILGVVVSADSCWPRNLSAVVEYQLAVRDAGAACARHASRITTRRIPRHSDLEASVGLTRHQHGRYVFGCRPSASWFSCCDAPNGSPTAATTSRPSPICSTPQTMTFFTVWKLTLITFSSHTCLTKLTYRISFEPALTQWLWSTKLNL